MKSIILFITTILLCFSSGFAAAETELNHIDHNVYEICDSMSITDSEKTVIVYHLNGNDLIPLPHIEFVIYTYTKPFSAQNYLNNSIDNAPLLEEILYSSNKTIIDKYNFDEPLIINLTPDAYRGVW